MKVLLGGIILIVVLGLGGFFYRNALEHPKTVVTACTLEAKVCPDGTTVGRTGPSCAFAPCLPPNVSIESAKIAFALPAGYAPDEGAPNTETGVVAAYVKISSTTNALQTITVRDFPISMGSTSDDVILAHTMLEPADRPPKDMSEFSPKIIGIRTFSEITIERFEGVVHSAYFLARQNDVLEFDIVEQDVENWSSPNLIVDNLPQHQALIKMLSTLEDASPQPN